LERVEQTAEQRTETEQRQQVAQGPRERGDQGVPRGMSGALRIPGGRRGALRRNEHRPAEAVTDLDLTGAAEPGGADRDHLRLLVAAVLARGRTVQRSVVNPSSSVKRRSSSRFLPGSEPPSAGPSRPDPSSWAVPSAASTFSRAFRAFSYAFGTCSTTKIASVSETS